MSSESPFVIERARPDDLDAIVEIEQLSFPSPWSRRALETEVKRLRPHSETLAARWNGRVVGFAVYWEIVDEAHLLNFAVHPSHRRKGVGRALLRALLEDASRKKLHRVTLEVRVRNDAAIRLYREFGFDILAVRKGYYQDTGEDAYIMWRNDIPPPDAP